MPPGWFRPLRSKIASIVVSWPTPVIIGRLGMPIFRENSTTGPQPGMEQLELSRNDPTTFIWPISISKRAIISSEDSVQLRVWGFSYDPPAHWSVCTCSCLWILWIILKCAFQYIEYMQISSWHWVTSIPSLFIWAYMQYSWGRTYGFNDPKSW